MFNNYYHSFFMDSFKPKNPELPPSVHSFSILRAAVFSLLTSACAHKPSAYSEPISEAYDKRSGRTESLLIEGDPNVGKVVHVRQIHGHRDLDEADQKEVARYQGQILNELLEVQPKSILSEMMYYGKNGVETAYGCHLTESGGDVDCFFDYVANNLSPEELSVLNSIHESTELAFLDEDQQAILDNLLLNHGADIVYGYIKGFENINWIMADSVHDRDDYEHYKTLVEDLSSDLSEKVLKKLLGKSIKANERRELSASRHVMSHLQDYPGRHVYIIYGAAHDFYDDFSKKRQVPEFREVVYESDLLDPKKRGNEQLFEGLMSYVQ